MIEPGNPAWWKSVAGVVATFLALFNVPGHLAPAVQATVGAAGMVVSAVYVWQHQAKQKNLDTLAAAVAAPARQLDSAAASLASDAGAHAAAGILAQLGALIPVPGAPPGSGSGPAVPPSAGPSPA